MTTQRWTPVRAAKVWLDIVLAFGGVATVLLILWLIVGPWMVRGGMPADASAAVAIGAETLLPRLPLQLSSDAAEFSSANLVWGYAELRAATTDWRLHLASMGFTAVASVIILYAIWLLREVVRETLSGRPFALEDKRSLTV